MPVLSLAAILEIIKGVLQFPDAVLKLIRILKNTPQEDHEKIIAGAQAWQKTFEDTGRPPSWD